MAGLCTVKMPMKVYVVDLRRGDVGSGEGWGNSKFEAGMPNFREGCQNVDSRQIDVGAILDEYNDMTMFVVEDIPSSQQFHRVAHPFGVGIDYFVQLQEISLVKWEENMITGGNTIG